MGKRRVQVTTAIICELIARNSADRGWHKLVNQSQRVRYPQLLTATSRSKLGRKDKLVEGDAVERYAAPFPLQFPGPRGLVTFDLTFEPTDQICSNHTSFVHSAISKSSQSTRLLAPATL